MKLYNLALALSLSIIPACSSSGSVEDDLTSETDKDKKKNEEATNQKPVISSVSFVGSTFTAAEPVKVNTSGVSDPDGDSVKLSYEWSVNGAKVAGATGDSLSASKFSRGDSVKCTVTPNDGQVDGDPAESREINIQNATPSVPTVKIYPLAGTAPSGLWAQLESPATDVDGDTITYEYTWYKDGAVQSSYAASTTAIPFADLTHGATWKVAVVAKDGTASSSTVNSQDRKSWTWNVKQIDSGMYHSCAVLSDGALKCWGRNHWGQTGVGFSGSTPVVTPLTAGAYTSGVKMVAVGELHTCALLNTGGVKCWGNNDDGQIGNNAQSSTAVLAPTDVVNATSGIVAISAGAYHTCALTTGGGVKCWGDNVTGGVGNDTSSNDVLTAQNVYGLTSGVKQITTGLGHSCALTTSGGVKCWGNNYFGQLGDGNTDTESDRPVNVVGLSSGVAAITAGYSFTCALLTTGAVKCWGDNYYRSLGAGSTENEVTDVLQVTGLTSGVAKLEAGQDHACVVLTGGTVKCWGRNSDGQTGIGSSSTSVDAPPTSGILSSIANVNPGGFFSCALSTVGDVMCWGNNQYGQMGNNTSGSTDVLTPVNVNTFDFD